MARTTRPAHRHAALIAAAQRAQLTAREVDDKSAPLAAITANRCTLRVRPTRARIEAVAKLLDRAGKGTGARRLDGESRIYPKFAPGMSTARYVEMYEAINSARSLTGSCTKTGEQGTFWQPLNTKPAALYEGGQLDFEVIGEEIPEQLPARAAEVPAALVPAAAAPALAITLNRAEGPAEECGRPVTVDSFTAADAVLRAWALTAPARGGYDKCDVSISWPAGGSYALRFDLQHADAAGPADLARHLVDTVAFYAGEACPEHLTADQYLQYLASLPPATAAAYAEIRQHLQALGAWREVARPAAVDLGAMLRAGTVQPAQLVGVGVVFTGYRDQANNQPRSAGAIVSAEPTAYGLRLRVLLEDGREEWPDVSRDFRDCGHRPALYRIDWRAHGAPYIAQLQAARALAVATKSSAAELARRALEDERAKLAAQFPELERVGSGSSCHATAARNLRRLLTTTWPGVKFIVRSRSYSGGCSIDVEWTDGPACELVDEIAGRFEGGSFDGMTDSYTHRRTPWTELFGDADYVHTRRQLSDGAVAAIIAQEWGDGPDAPTRESLRALGWAANDANRRINIAARTWSAPMPAGHTARRARSGRGGPAAPALA